MEIRPLSGNRLRAKIITDPVQSEAALPGVAKTARIQSHLLLAHFGLLSDIYNAREQISKRIFSKSYTGEEEEEK